MSQEEIKAKKLRKVVAGADGIVNFIFLAVLLAMLALGFYSLWDSNKVYADAGSENYEVYKPTEDPLSFEELQKINPEVIGWINIYGTNIDYPLVQGEDNIKYLNTSATGEYSFSGAIYLDSRNKSDLTDYKNIIHGHHMEKSEMFGDIDKFAKKDFFDGHLYGNIYIGGQDKGLVIFEVAIVDAYDDDVYQVPIVNPNDQKENFDYLKSLAYFSREMGQDEAEHIVLLSTCNGEITNGRYMLMAYVTDQTYEDPFYVPPKEKPVFKGLDKFTGDEARMPLWGILLIILAIMTAALIVFDSVEKHKRKKEERNLNNQRN